MNLPWMRRQAKPAHKCHKGAFLSHLAGGSGFIYIIYPCKYHPIPLHGQNMAPRPEFGAISVSLRILLSLKR